ncbi:MAG: carboxymuconolactone decarboxylase family protein [SAR324 cluster bacterium]|nr:carboxymuconolactone decarboxylase family protein [SAR324 cluster bacterium]
MPFLKSMPMGSFISDVYARKSDRFKHWPEFTNDILRGDSALSKEFRQLISCYISGLNACRYCFGTHQKIAEAFGYSQELIVALFDNVDTAPIDERLKPILKYLKILTETPAKLSQSDADAIFAAGWDDDAFSDAVTLGALWNFVNRMAMGHGLETLPEEVMQSRADAIVSKTYP